MNAEGKVAEMSSTSTGDDLGPATQAATSAVFKGGQSAAIILTQRFLGAKPF